MFNENPGTSILMRRGGSTVARTEAPFCLSLFLAGAALWNELAESVYVFLRGSAAHEEKKKTVVLSCGVHVSHGDQMLKYS